MGLSGRVVPYLCLVLVQQAVDALDLRGEVALGQEGQDAGDLDHGHDVIAVLGAEVADAEDREAGAVVAGCLGGGHLHGLLLEHELALQVSGDGGAREGNHGDDGADPQRADPDGVVAAVPAEDAGGFAGDHLAVGPDRVDAVVAAAPQVVPGDAEQEPAGDGEGAEESVRARRPGRCCW